MITNVSIDSFFALPQKMPLIDVRTPAEFAHGHTPAAFNIPIFDNEERIKVGTTYKQIGREEAILLGFDLVGNKWSGFIRQALEISPQKKVAVHCWRGGMRSGAMAWALNLYGFDVYLIHGGYKNYRKWVLQQFEKPYDLLVLGGMTGSGKTEILKQLAAKGEQVIDLEDLAQHQGSSYGTMNRMLQPTQEQFENNFAAKLRENDISKRIWIEDESLTIGARSIPKPFWEQIRTAPVVTLQVTREERIKKLVSEYGTLDKDFLIACTERIRKRLGPEQTKYAIESINSGDMVTFISLVLVYYDKTYKAGLAKREEKKVHLLEVRTVDATINATEVLNFADNNFETDNKNFS